MKSKLIEMGPINLTTVRKLPSGRLRGANRELAHLYSQPSSVQKVLASVLNAARIQQVSAFLITREAVQLLVANDPNMTSKIDTKKLYKNLIGTLNSYGALNMPNKIQAAVFFLNPETISILGISPEKSASSIDHMSKYLAARSATRTAKIQPVRDEVHQTLNESTTTPQPQLLNEVTEMANEIFKIYGPDEAAWEDALEGHLQYEELREQLKALTNQFHKTLEA